MPKQMREEMMKSASEQKLRKRWLFFDRVFRSRPGSDNKQANRAKVVPGSLHS